MAQCRIGSASVSQFQITLSREEQERNVLALEGNKMHNAGDRTSRTMQTGAYVTMRGVVYEWQPGEWLPSLRSERRREKKGGIYARCD